MLRVLRCAGPLLALLLLAAWVPLSATVSISSIVPDAGQPIGGTSITISGTGFQAGATVTIGGASAGGVVIASAQTITCTAPAGTLGSQPLVVTNPDTSNVSAAFIYTSTPAPTISVGGVAPSGGSPAGGTAVSITGTGFQAGATVSFGANGATAVTVVSATSITCTAPPGPVGAAAVVVTNPDTQISNATVTFAYAPPPAITTVAPSKGPVAGGTALIISGSAFQAGATVTVGGKAATSVVVSATSISCVTPSGAAGPVSVVVTNPDSQFASRGFTYQGSGPTIGAVRPALAPASGGTPLTITGTGFLASSVTIGGAPATSVVVVTSTSITCVSPPGTPGAANVVVTNNDLTSAQTGTLGNAFVYQGTDQPTITLISPEWGPVGTPITISGINYQPGAQVSIDRVAAGNVVVVNAQTVTCVIPPGLAGAVTVTVTNPDFLSAIVVDGFNVANPNDLSAHKCGGAHGISTLLLAPLIAWRLLALRARRRRDAGS